MEILFSFVLPAGFLSTVGLFWAVITLKKSLRETKETLTEVVDLIFGKGVEIRLKDNQGNILIQETVSAAKEEMGGKLDEAEVVAKRYAQNKLHIFLDLSSRKVEEENGKVVLEFTQAPPRP